MRPRSARTIASRKLALVIRSRRANRANHFVMKIRMTLPDTMNYSTVMYISGYSAAAAGWL
jgi:hypothetical protein